MDICNYRVASLYNLKIKQAVRKKTGGLKRENDIKRARKREREREKEKKER